MLRKHQRDMITAVDRIIYGSSIRNIIVKATPGSGKSTIPIIAGKLIPAGLADAICWICPRTSLQDQAERNFIDPFFRQLLNHNLTIRQSTNDMNPCRGLNGIVSTYQAVGVDKYQTLLNDFYHKRYILVLDEYHHAEAEDGSWTKALMPLYEHAAYRVLMTGTMSRGDGKKIAFTPYSQTVDGFVASLEGDRETHVIEYTRSQALAEKAILPLVFMFADGSSKWQKKTGRTVEAKLSRAEGESARHALYTALNTEYAKELLVSAADHWKAHRRIIPHAKLLVVAAGIKNAKEYSAFLKSMGLNARIATSENGPDAIKAIKAYKQNKVDILVSVNICYEGLDVPAISHVACLTTIRTSEWIEQMAARAARVDPNGGPYEVQKAFVFAPADKMFLEIKEKIEAEQLAVVREKEAAAKKGGNGNGEFALQVAPGGIVPLFSEMTGRREVLLNGNGNGTAPTMTSSEIEADLLEQIDDHLRGFAFDNRYELRKLNSQVYEFFGKPRRQMTIGELRNCLAHVKSVYPRNQIRGTGHKRVPAKAQPINVIWRER